MSSTFPLQSLSASDKKRLAKVNVLYVPMLLLWGLFCFNVGHLSGLQKSSIHQQNILCPNRYHRDGPSDGGNAANHYIMEKQSANDTALRPPLSDNSQQRRQQQQSQQATHMVLSEGVSEFAVGFSSISRDDFLHTFDTGLPTPPSSEGNNQVLLIYSEKDAFPGVLQSNGQVLNASAATANCKQMHMVLTSTQVDHGRQQCVAIVGYRESFHIHKFLRRATRTKDDNDSPKAAASKSFALYSRGESLNPTEPVVNTPTREQSLFYWRFLKRYMSNLETVLKQLRPIAEAAVVDRTIVVMHCPFGKSELLLNFICSLKRRNIDTSALLVFATDQKTFDLTSGMGVSVFYDSINYADMPEDPAVLSMLAKLFCVHTVNALGYHVLFQDVDMIWYRDPLEYFDSVRRSDAIVDIFFQEDGSRDLTYSPYSASTGFYLVKHNDRTRHFLHSLLLAGDLILASKSYQAVVSAIVAEHANLFRLKIKVLSNENGQFAGGFHFHRRKEYMRDLLTESDSVQPYIFHMSWTSNKEETIQYFQQMGEWHVRDDTCTQKSKEQILLAAKGDSVKDTVAPLESLCCNSEPQIICHYRDKPSKIPCT